MNTNKHTHTHISIFKVVSNLRGTDTCLFALKCRGINRLLLRGVYRVCVGEGDDPWVPPITSRFPLEEPLDENPSDPGPPLGPDKGKVS